MGDINEDIKEVIEKFDKLQEQSNDIRSEIVYLSKDGKVCDKSVAEKAIIREFNNDGELIKESWLEKIKSTSKKM